MKNKKLTNKKLKTIATLSAITICSSIATSTIKSDAMVSTHRLANFSRLFGKSVSNCFGKLLSRAWTKVKGIFASKPVKNPYSDYNGNKDLPNDPIYATVKRGTDGKKTTVHYRASEVPKKLEQTSSTTTSTGSRISSDEEIYSEIY